MKNYKPYIKYKNSGSTWLGDIPEHWEVRSFKNILTERNEKNNPIKTKEILSLSIDKGVTLYAEKTTNLDRFKDDFTQYKLARKNDLVFNSMNMIVGAVGVSKYFGCVSPVYYTYYGGADDIKTAKFYEYLFRNKIVQGFLFSLGRGLMAIDRGDGKYNTLRLKVSRDDLRSLKLPFPNLIEQTTIANFLDYKTAKIDRFIRKKKQLIKLLNEQKAGIINQAVTKGLDANAKMKPSGIEWLGDIPEHWEVRKLSTIISNAELGGNYDSSLNSEGIAVMKMGNIDRSIIKLVKVEKLNLDSEYDLKHLLQNNDFLFNTRNSTDLVGKVAIWRNEIPKALYNSNILKISFKKFVSNEFMNYLFNSKSILNVLKLISKGTTNVSAIYYKDLSKMQIWIMPLIEQQQIVSYIEQETTKLKKVIDTIEKEITLVQEYKTVLIAEAVTGKIDVRDFVIPEIIEEETYEDLEEELDMVAEDGEEIEME